MHPNSIEIMKGLLSQCYPNADEITLTVADYGSMEHAAGPGTYRPLIPPSWAYLGCDLEAGPNVNVIMPGEYDTGLATGSVDIVISGQCLEHTRNPFKAVAEMARILKPGGTMILIAPFIWEVHRFPIDCWRFCPDGMDTLMTDAGIRTVLADISFHDCYALGVKI